MTRQRARTTSTLLVAGAALTLALASLPSAAIAAEGKGSGWFPVMKTRNGYVHYAKTMMATPPTRLQKISADARACIRQSKSGKLSGTIFQTRYRGNNLNQPSRRHYYLSFTYHPESRNVTLRSKEEGRIQMPLRSVSPTQLLRLIELRHNTVVENRMKQK